MKIWMRGLSAMLVILLAMSMAACGKDPAVVSSDVPDVPDVETSDTSDVSILESEPTSTDVTESTTAPTTKKQEKTTAKPTAAKTTLKVLESQDTFNMGGKEIRIAAWWDDLPSGKADNVTSKKTYQRMLDLEKKYNCKFKAVVVSQGDISTQLEAHALSGDDFAEIVYMRCEGVNTLIAKERLMAVNGYIDLSLSQYDETVTKMFTRDGKSYAFTPYKIKGESNMLFNKSIFKKVGLEMPYDLVAKKEWTWDKFKEYLNKATIMKAGSSEPEVYGFYGVTGDPAVSHVAASFGAEFAHVDANGKYSSGLTESKMITALNFIRDLNSNSGVLIPPATASWDYGVKQFQAGKVAMIINGISGLDLKNDMSDEFGIIPIPTAKKGGSYPNMVQSYNVCVMPKQLEKDPTMAKQIATVFTLFKAPTDSDPDKVAAETRASYESQLWDKESVDYMMSKETDKTVRLMNHYSAAGSVFWDSVSAPLTKALKGVTTVASVVESAKDAYETAIDNYNEENS